MHRLAVLFGAILLVAGCTVRNAYVFPPHVQKRYRITGGDVQRSYRSLGQIQITRKGANLFGFVSVVDADLEKMFGEILIREMQARGADGIINMRFHETQHTVATKLLFAFPLFFVPLPTKVELTGELIRFTPPPPARAAPSSAPATGPRAAGKPAPVFEPTRPGAFESLRRRLRVVGRHPKRGETIYAM
jgi:hypothetical protein